MAEPTQRPQPQPYKIAVSDELLNWINDRVRTARLPVGRSFAAGEEGTVGLPGDTAQKMKEYWTQQYDWRAVEKKLNNELKQFVLPIDHDGDTIRLHFVHHPSTRPNAVPLLFLHGWPGSFMEIGPIINALTSPESPSEQAYHVVAPSLPGFCFSSLPAKPFSPWDHAAVIHSLMQQLGYNIFMVQGGDWGSIIARIIASTYPETCPAIHVNMVTAVPPSPLWNPLSLGRLVLGVTTGFLQSEYEGKMMKRMMWWESAEKGYMQIQGTKPLTIQYALSDSPLGFACWVRDKVELLIDDEFHWSHEDIITMVMVRWQETGSSSTHCQIRITDNPSHILSMDHQVIQSYTATRLAIFRRNSVPDLARSFRAPRALELQYSPKVSVPLHCYC